MYEIQLKFEGKEYKKASNELTSEAKWVWVIMKKCSLEKLSMSKTRGGIRFWQSLQHWQLVLTTANICGIMVTNITDIQLNALDWKLDTWYGLGLSRLSLCRQKSYFKASKLTRGNIAWWKLEDKISYLSGEWLPFERLQVAGCSLEHLHIRSGLEEPVQTNEDRSQ